MGELDRKLVASRLTTAMIKRRCSRSQWPGELTDALDAFGCWGAGWAGVPPVTQLFALSRALGVTTDWLLGLSDDGGPE